MDVLEYFRLDEEPFRLSPSPRFLYLNDQVKQATSKVEYMTKHRTAPLYMYGSIGSGKTSILRRLYEELSEDDTYTLRLLIAPNIKTSNSFLRAVMDAFGVATDRAYERSLKLFEAFLIDQYKQGKVPTLFVDEAQNMTRDILKLIHYLLNYETSDVKLLQIVLTGQEELSEKVKRYKELASRMIPIAINPMSPVDLEDMLKFRWSIAAGNKSELPFSQEALTEIFAYSKGLPRDAIKLSDEVLRTIFLQQVPTATIEHVRNAGKDLDLEKLYGRLFRTHEVGEKTSYYQRGC
jgi:general secretion pathway protein A